MSKLETLLDGIKPIRVIGPVHRDVAGIAADSRHVRPGYVFVAIPGIRQDGRAFIADAISRGATAIVWQERSAGRTGMSGPPSVPLFSNGGSRSDLTWIEVQDARRCLALLAVAFYQHPSRQLTVIGVTGTNGKTTVVYLVGDILRADGRRPGLLSTVEYKIADRTIPASRTTPDAVTLQRFLAEMVAIGCRSVALEVSSHALDQSRTEGVEFDVAIFTNLTRDHLDYHGTMERYLGAKQRLFRDLGASKQDAVALVNVDDPAAPRIVEAVRSSCRRLTYGLMPAADISAESVELTSTGSTFRARTPWGNVSIRLPLIGRHNISNALASLGAGAAVGVPLERIAATLAHPSTVPGRLEEIPTGQAFRVFVDYAHTADALERALDALRLLARNRLIAVFGCGGARDPGKRPAMGAVASRLAHHTILTSDNPRTEDPLAIATQIRSGFSPEASVEVEPDRGRAIRRAIEIAKEGDVLLIAGKGHETFQECAHRIIPFDDRSVVRQILATHDASPS